MPIAPYDLLRVARQAKDQPLKTIGGRAEFRVEVVGDRIYVVPSTKKPRPLSGGMDECLAHYNKTRSLTPRHYQDITYNSSYLLRLIAMAEGR